MINHEGFVPNNYNKPLFLLFYNAHPLQRVFFPGFDATTATNLDSRFGCNDLTFIPLLKPILILLIGKTSLSQ